MNQQEFEKLIKKNHFITTKYEDGEVLHYIKKNGDPDWNKQPGTYGIEYIKESDYYRFFINEDLNGKAFCVYDEQYKTLKQAYQNLYIVLKETRTSYSFIRANTIMLLLEKKQHINQNEAQKIAFKLSNDYLVAEEFLKAEKDYYPRKDPVEIEGYTAKDLHMKYHFDLVESYLMMIDLKQKPKETIEQLNSLDNLKEMINHTSNNLNIDNIKAEDLDK